jgi:hypothetical protein
MDSSRPAFTRSHTSSSAHSGFEGPTKIYREQDSPPPLPRVQRTTTEPPRFANNLRPTNRLNTNDIFGDQHDDSTVHSSSPDRSYGDRSTSPATSAGSGYPSRSPSSQTLNAAYTTGGTGRKAPPPPPIRGKKPPPPPPVKRGGLMGGQQVYN